MRKPWYQRFLIYYIPWLFAAILFVGAVLDTIVSSLELISPITTYIGTSVVIVGIVGLEIYLRRHPLPWVTQGGQTIRFKSLWPWLHILALGVLICLWIPRLGMTSPRDQQYQTDLLVSCEIVRNSPVTFEEYNLEAFKWGEEGDSIITFPPPDDESQTNYHPVPSEFTGLVSYFVECRITNLSDKNVSLEYVRSFLAYRVVVTP